MISVQRAGQTGAFGVTARSRAALERKIELEYASMGSLGMGASAAILLKHVVINLPAIHVWKLLYVNKCKTRIYPSFIPLAQWSKWSPWRDCSASCGEGISNRERVCIRKTPSSPECSGTSIEESKCEIAVCPSGTQ